MNLGSVVYLLFLIKSLALFLGPRECGDADPIVRATDHCSDGMRDHIQRVMAHLRAVA